MLRFASFALLALGALRAHAAEPKLAATDEARLPLELDWKAPPECPTAAAIHAELTRITRVRPGRLPPTVVARVRIDKGNGRYHLVLKTEREGELGKRDLSATECSALAREVTLVLALTFGDGVALASEPEDVPAPEAEPPSRAVEAEPEVRVAPDSPSPARGGRPSPAEATGAGKSPAARTGPRALRIAGFAGVGALLGALPATALRGFAGAELGRNRFWVSPQLDAVLPVDDALPRGVSARYDAAGGSLAGCAALVPSPRLAACVLLGAMAVRGRSAGASRAGTAVAPWYLAGGQLSATWPSASLVSARLDAALLASLNAPRFTVDGLGEAHTIPRMSVTLGASLLLSP